MTINQIALRKAERKLRKQLQLELCLRANICPICGKTLSETREQIGPSNYKVWQKKKFCKNCHYSM